MKTKDCQSVESFNHVKDYIQKHGKHILLSKRVVAGQNTRAKEIVLGDKVIALADSSKETIIVIDTLNTIPTYTNKVDNKQMIQQGYGGMIETENIRLQWANDWCKIVSQLNN